MNPNISYTFFSKSSSLSGPSSLTPLMTRLFDLELFPRSSTCLHRALCSILLQSIAFSTFWSLASTFSMHSNFFLMVNNLFCIWITVALDEVCCTCICNLGKMVLYVSSHSLTLLLPRENSFLHVSRRSFLPVRKVLQHALQHSKLCTTKCTFQNMYVVKQQKYFIMNKNVSRKSFLPVQKVLQQA